MAPPAGTVTNTASISRCLGFAASSSSAVVGVGVDDKNTDGDDHDDAHGGGRDFAIIEEGTERYLVAARGLEAGRVLFDHVGGSLSGERTRHSIQIQGGLHMEADSDLIFMNHSCEPNCQLEVVSVDEATGIPVGEKVRKGSEKVYCPPVEEARSIICIQFLRTLTKPIPPVALSLRRRQC